MDGKARMSLNAFAGPAARRRPRNSSSQSNSFGQGKEVLALLAAVRFDTFFGDGWAKGGLAICH
jgi:hypothetical protein